MRNAGLDELQAGIRIGGRNINNLRYADNTTLLPESEEELKSLLMRVKEESERAILKLNIKKKKNQGIRPHYFMEKRGGKGRSSDRFELFWGSKITVDGDCSHEIRRRLLLGGEAMVNLDSVFKAETLLCRHRSI